MSIPIIGDSILVDMESGTGVVKITPAHDENDFECGRRHHLPRPHCIDDRGELRLKTDDLSYVYHLQGDEDETQGHLHKTYSDRDRVVTRRYHVTRPNEGGKHRTDWSVELIRPISSALSLHGMNRIQARTVISDLLAEQGALIGIDRGRDTVVSRCSRSGDIIEPMLKPQWYLRTAAMAERVLTSVSSEDMSLVEYRNVATKDVNGDTYWQSGSANHSYRSSNGSFAHKTSSSSSGGGGGPNDRINGSVEKLTSDDTANKFHKMTIAPPEWHAHWNRWLKAPHDWCLSRQLWWGHRIPAWRVKRTRKTVEFGGGDEERNGHGIRYDHGGNGKVERGEEDRGTKEIWVAANSEQEALDRGRLVLLEGEDDIASADDFRFEAAQDEDVLDTWFSSALLPLSALGWEGVTQRGSRSFDPSVREHIDHETTQWTGGDGFYPLSVMETGSDILFFWVARMAMLCSELDGGAEAWSQTASRLAGGPNRCGGEQDDTKADGNRKRLMPFHGIAIHPLVRDSTGRKMSKSLGNVIDPLHVIDGVSLETLLEGIGASVTDEQERKRKEDTNKMTEKTGKRKNYSSAVLGADEIERASKNIRREFPQGIEACGADALRFCLVRYFDPTNMERTHECQSIRVFK